MRATSTLRSVARIYAEDTRHSQHLLKHYNIRTPVSSLHEHNEAGRLTQIESSLLAGDDLAIISDAGTPLISDPGYRIVSHCLDNGLRVSPIPGPSALLAALCSSGLATDSFVFCGFPPSKSAARLKWLQELVPEHRTLVFFESRHRIIDTLAALQSLIDDSRLLTLARELTKRFESIKKGTAAELLEWLSADQDRQKGEFVVLLSGQSVNSESERQADDEARRILKILLTELSVKGASDCAASITGLKRNHVYKLALAIASE